METRRWAAVDLPRAFPLALASDARIVQSRWAPDFQLSDEAVVQLSTGPVAIPGRVYGDVPDATSLDATQRLIFDCISTRHSDGYVRQAHIEPLLGQHEEWICPFVWMLLGEYVIEIVQLIVDHADQLDHALYAEFLARNPPFRELTYHRAVSYWNEYRRRRLRSFSMYPAFALFERFELPSPLKRK
jgi:hypothetical protein